MGRATKTWNRLFFPAVIGAIIAYLIYHRDIYLTHSPEERQQQTSQESKQTNIPKPKIRTHGEVCAGKLCFIMQDLIFKQDDRVDVIRVMEIKDTGGYSYSLGFLKVPEEYDEEFTQTRHWSVDKTRLFSTYARTMIGLAFAMESLTLKSEEWQNVLLIGLGGGAMTNFFSTLEYAMMNTTTVELHGDLLDVAKDYFDVTESETNRIIIEDGAKFVQDAAENGDQYRAIFVDACYNYCPSEPFLDPITIKSMADALHRDGYLAVNVLPKKDQGEEIARELVQLYSKYFETCYYQPVQQQGILVCSHRINWSLEQQAERFIKNLRPVDQALGLALLD
ncbi:unnamed protein product [Nippostrongylus brasiliensis]|uniref:Methyltransferase-like protein 13 n=1 Tax=Nippostrongylus brasiliensis TaxID=27835 RepID=A0A0N4Y549_NIPBR|nr:unnamed protein product [Nippostrongylus brasiliensis]